jgi:hypothetical protein
MINFDLSLVWINGSDSVQRIPFEQKERQAMKIHFSTFFIDTGKCHDNLFGKVILKQPNTNKNNVYVLFLALPWNRRLSKIKYVNSLFSFLKILWEVHTYEQIYTNSIRKQKFRAILLDRKVLLTR